MTMEVAVKSEPFEEDPYLKIGSVTPVGKEAEPGPSRSSAAPAVCVKNKTHFCKFCKKLVGQLKRHMTSVHKNEEEVKDYIADNYNTFKMRLIRTSGDAEYDKIHPTSPIAVREHRVCKHHKKESPNCASLISKHHVKSCLNPKAKHTSSHHAMQVSYHNVESPQEEREDMSERQCSVIAESRQFAIRELCEKDTTLILYGNSECARLGKKECDEVASQSLQVVASIFLKMKASEPDLKSVAEAFIPHYYSVFEKAVNGMLEAGVQGGKENQASLKAHYGSKFRVASDHLLLHLMKQQDLGGDADDLKILKTKIENLKLWQDEYNRCFNKGAAFCRKSRVKNTKRTTLEDRQRLVHSVYATVMEYQGILMNEPFTTCIYNMLTKALMLKMLILNSERLKEVDEMELSDWLSAQGVKEDSAEYRALSASEQKFSSSFIVRSIIGKAGKDVPLIVSKTDAVALSKLIELRPQAGIPDTNMYLFAIGCSHYDRAEIMKELADKCVVQHPELLTDERHSKYMAACLRFLCLNDEDLRRVSKMMGYTDETHLSTQMRSRPMMHLGAGSRFMLALDAEDDQTNREKPLVNGELDSDKGRRQQLLFTDESTESSDSAESLGSPVRQRRFSRRNATKRMRWSHEQKAAVSRRFYESIRLDRLPPSKDVMEELTGLAEEFPEFKNQNLPKMKAMIKNLSNEAKRGIFYS